MFNGPFLEKLPEPWENESSTLLRSENVQFHRCRSSGKISDTSFQVWFLCTGLLAIEISIIQGIFGLLDKGPSKI